MKRSEYRTSLLSWRAAVITFVTAILSVGVTIVTGVLPLVGDVADRDGTITERDRVIDSLNQEIDSANARLEVRQETIESLRDENTELRAALPYTVQPEDVSDIRASATITLADRGDTIDLNSTLPNFRADDYIWQDSLQYDGSRLRLGYGVSSLTLSEGNADYASCAAATGWAEATRLDPHALSVPSTCLRLGSGRFAAIQVLRYDENSADVVVTVWE